MRLTILLIYKITIICNILIIATPTRELETSDITSAAAAAAAAAGTVAAAAAANFDSDLDSKDKHHLKYNNIPPPLPYSNTNTLKTTTTTTATTTTINTARRQLKVCPGIRIRNDLKSFEQLRGCNIIDGPLTIALVSNSPQPYESKHYENITFPDLYEITEYLLFFRVQGLTTLSNLFPNLSVIRGKELVSNYALIIYEMLSLQKIDLPRLTDILRGSVRIEHNPNLCYVSTVNWEAISKHIFTPHFIKENNLRCNNRCPDNCRLWDIRVQNTDIVGKQVTGDYKELGHTTANKTKIFCWSNQVCHEMCQSTDGVYLPRGPNGGCCATECAGGCFMDEKEDQCKSCRTVSQDNRCVKRCDLNLYEYKERCITEQECTSMTEVIQQNQCVKASDGQVTRSNFKAIRLRNDMPGICQVSCPPNHEEDPTDTNKCKPCDKEKCRKVCTPTSDKSFMVTNVDSLRDLSGCNVINGSLEISMKGGKNVLHELETAFLELEEIKGFLKITRSYPILTLGFLSRLKAINGSELDRGQYSLIIIDNPNLQELFVFKKSDDNQKQLIILEGKIFIHLNPKLCPHRIQQLKSYALVADWDERDVSLHTNGDKEACNTQKLETQYLRGTARAAMIRFQNFANMMDDPRSLLYYLINYREAPHGNVTMFDGRDGCNSQNDVWMTSEEAPIYSRSHSNKSNDYQEAAINVKPATRYALFVKTFTIFAGSTSAISDIIYFETAPDTPTIPKELESTATDHDSILVSWSPPSRPNGLIKRYLITVKKEPEMEDYQNIDPCQLNRPNSIAQAPAKDDTRPALVQYNTLKLTSSNDTSANSELGTCRRVNFDTDVDIQKEVVSFQDMIIDIVYIKQPCPFNLSSTSKTVKKRSVDNGIRSLEDAGSVSQIFFKSPLLEPVTEKPKNNPPSNETNTPPIIRFDRAKGKIEVNITADKGIADSRLTYVIKDLEHFTLYTIEVVACHGDTVGNNSKHIMSKTYSKCSLQAITQVRTKPIEEYDRVFNQTVILHRANESSSDNIISWTKPNRPNGLILGYRVHFRPKNSPKHYPVTEGCVNLTTYNRDGGFILPEINPGSYVLNIQTITMNFGHAMWMKEEFNFDIPQNYLVSPLVMVILITLGVVILVFAVASGTYYYQKKKHELENGLIYASVNPDYIQYDPDEWEVDKSNLQIGIQIGTGSFGMVFKGQLITEKGNLNCAIKTVPPTSTAKQRMDFLREASIMKQFDTFHVVKLMGVVSTTNPVYVIMEFMENGDLKSFLRSMREVYQREKRPLVEDIYLMAAQIADGMAYLASKKFVHRDLAARNCMVGENRVVKIGDFGLTRDIYVNDYYRRDTQGRLPVRWMAPESLKDNIYTSASDVWSYGIVVWEMVTFSAYPYQGQSNDEVIKRVIQGFTMARPDNCSDKLFHIMERCWRKNERERPTFNDLVESLLPETGDKLYPNCFYRKQKTAGDSILTQPNPDENNARAESYALLSWPSNQTNGLTNGVKHAQSNIDEKKT